MKNFKSILTIVFGIFMILGGVAHFLNPEYYNEFIPDFLSEVVVNYASGLLEVALGVGCFLPAYRSKATLGILILMIAFLPLHVWDVFKESPAMGSHTAALIRLPLQVVLILWAWFIHARN